MKKLLLASALVLPIAASAASPPPFPNPQPVIVTNPQGQGAHVFVDNPITPVVGTPQRIEFNFNVDALSNPTAFTVPAGQRLTVEFVSAGCRTFNATVSGLAVWTVGADGFTQLAKHIYLLSTNEPDTPGNFGSDFVFYSPVKAYFNPGDNITVISSGHGGRGVIGGGANPTLTCDIILQGTLTPTQ